MQPDCLGLCLLWSLYGTGSLSCQQWTWYRSIQASACCRRKLTRELGLDSATGCSGGLLRPHESMWQLRMYRRGRQDIHVWLCATSPAKFRLVHARSPSTPASIARAKRKTSVSESPSPRASCIVSVVACAFRTGANGGGIRPDGRPRPVRGVGRGANLTAAALHMYEPKTVSRAWYTDSRVK